MDAMGWWGGARGALGPEQLVAELSDSPAAPGGKDMISTPCVHMLGMGFSSWPLDLSVWPSKLQGAPGLPSFLHKALCCPLVS